MNRIAEKAPFSDGHPVTARQRFGHHGMTNIGITLKVLFGSRCPGIALKSPLPFCSNIGKAQSRAVAVLSRSDRRHRARSCCRGRLRALQWRPAASVVRTRTVPSSPTSAVPTTARPLPSSTGGHGARRPPGAAPRPDRAACPLQLWTTREVPSATGMPPSWVANLQRLPRANRRVSPAERAAQRTLRPESAVQVCLCPGIRTCARLHDAGLNAWRAP